MTLDEVGVRFSKPFALDGPNHLVDALGSTYNRRLDRSVALSERKQANIDWRLLWLMSLYNAGRGAANPLQWWTRKRRTDAVALLTWTSAASMSAFTWWGDRTSIEWAVDVAEEPADPCDEPDPFTTTLDLKAPVPRSGSVALQTFLSSVKTKRASCPARPMPLSIHQQRLDGRATNPYELYRVGASGQGVQLATLSSYLGSSAHLAASYRLLRRQPDLPTALLPIDGQWDALGRYVATLPSIALQISKALVHGMDNVAAVEFPVVWCGLGEDGMFVYSRIDALTWNSDRSVDVWEWKTKWGVGRSYEKRALLRDVRQAVIYCFAFSIMTGVRVRLFHVRYAGVAADGTVTLTTHSFRFDGARLRPLLQHALDRTTAYVDHNFATVGPIKVDARTVMPAYEVLRLARVRPLLLPTAAAAKPRGLWFEHATGALFVAKPTTRKVLGNDGGVLGSDGGVLGNGGGVLGNGGGYNGHKELDASIKARGVVLARRVTRCLEALSRRLSRLFGGSTGKHEGRRVVAADVLVIRALNRGVNGLVGSGASDIDLRRFVHDSSRAGWSKEAIRLAHKVLEPVAALIEHEIKAVCRRHR